MVRTRDLRGSRRDIAVVLTGGQRTAHEIAKALGKPTGSIFGVLRRMHTEGLLEADSDPGPPTRGTQYSLSDGGTAALAEALTGDRNTGHLSEGQRILIVDRRKRLDKANEVVGGAATAGLVAWGLEFSTGWILVLVNGADPYRIRELESRLEKSGCRCLDVTVDAVAPAALLRQRAGRLAGLEEAR